MGLEPVLAIAGISNQWNAQGEGRLHLFDDDALHLLLFFWVYGEVEFVVHLENHLALDTFSLEAIEDLNHGYLDDISSGALNGGIDGISLSKASNSGIMRIDVWQVATR